jgi:hypothetical protein
MSDRQLVQPSMAVIGRGVPPLVLEPSVWRELTRAFVGFVAFIGLLAFVWASWFSLPGLFAEYVPAEQPPTAVSCVFGPGLC